MSDYASEGTLTTDVREVATSETWDTQTEWEAYQSKASIVIESGVLKLDQASIPETGDYQWYIDAGSGSTLDADVGAVTATTAGGPTWESDSTAVGGYHLSHDGVDDVWTTDSGVLTTPFSVGGWVRFDDMTAFDNGIASNNSDWYVDSDGAGALVTVMGGGSRISGHSFPSAGNWGFFALNVKATEHRLITWSNSQELADTTNTNAGASESDTTLTVGTHHNDGWLSGDTDFYVVSEGSVLTKTEWADLWEATQR